MNQRRSDGAAGGEHFSVVAVAASHDMVALKNIAINSKKVKKNSQGVVVVMKFSVTLTRSNDSWILWIYLTLCALDASL